MDTPQYDGRVNFKLAFQQTYQTLFTQHEHCHFERVMLAQVVQCKQNIIAGFKNQKLTAIEFPSRRTTQWTMPECGTIDIDAGIIIGVSVKGHFGMGDQRTGKTLAFGFLPEDKQKRTSDSHCIVHLHTASRTFWTISKEQVSLYSFQLDSSSQPTVSQLVCVNLEAGPRFYRPTLEHSLNETHLCVAHESGLVIFDRLTGKYINMQDSSFHNTVIVTKNYVCVTGNSQQIKVFDLATGHLRNTIKSMPGFETIPIYALEGDNVLFANYSVRDVGTGNRILGSIDAETQRGFIYLQNRTSIPWQRGELVVADTRAHLRLISLKSQRYTGMMRRDDGSDTVKLFGGIDGNIVDWDGNKVFLWHYFPFGVPLNVNVEHAIPHA